MNGVNDVPEDGADPDRVDRERSLDLLWSAQRRPTRGPRPALSIAKIVETAIGVADAEGLEALSMQRVAGELGYTAMSLYRYVPAKTQLVDLMVDAACGLPPQTTEEAGDWRAEVHRWVAGLWEVYRRHPWMVRIQIRTPPIGPNQLAWFESALRSLSVTGLPGDELAGTLMFLTGAVRDLARLSGELVPMGLGYPQVLANILDRDRFPTVARLVAAPSTGESSMASTDVGPAVEFGIHLLLDGLEARVRANRKRR